jgi:tetratricopeptide (TPR) repeat protein
MWANLQLIIRKWKTSLPILLITQAFFAQSGFEAMICKKGQYQQAIDAYSSVLSTNKQSSELYYNNGNSYYKLNKVAPQFIITKSISVKS